MREAEGKKTLDSKPQLVDRDRWRQLRRDTCRCPSEQLKRHRFRHRQAAFLADLRCAGSKPLRRDYCTDGLKNEFMLLRVSIGLQRLQTILKTKLHYRCEQFLVGHQTSLRRLPTEAGFALDLRFYWQRSPWAISF